MKRVLYILTALVLAASCSSDTNSKVTFSVSDAPDSTEVVVAKLNINRVSTVDTIYVEGGKFTFSAMCQPGAPDFYYFYADGSKLGSLVLQEGDNIEVTATLKGGITLVEGSEEGARYAEIDKKNDESLRRVEVLSQALGAAQSEGDEKRVKEVTKELSRLFVDLKQEATKYMYNNSSSITIIPVMYQRVSPELPLFGEVNDVFIFKAVYDSLYSAYPNSPYVASLADDIRQRELYISLGNKVLDAQEMSHPNISLYDQNAKVRNLSELDGKVIILSFWSTTEPTHKVFNAELKDIYKRYREKGLEVYQVCADIDKTVWARQVKDQELEWVSVCDPGNVSRTLDLYNVQKLPALFIIDRDGDIVEKDLFDPAKLERAVSRLVR